MLWYEANEPKTPLIKMYCPVCKNEGFLGKREKNCLFVAYCTDCRATYTWQPNEDNPTVMLECDKRHKHCGCGNCQK